MVATAIRSKAQRLFEMLDENSDGFITADDFQRTAKRLISAFGMADSPKARALKDNYTEAWKEIAGQADIDHDGRISRQEYEKAFVEADRTGILTLIDRAAVAEFAVADGDDDGMLSREEAARMLQAFGVSQAELDDAVAVLDRDGDGRISQQEYREALREFYLSADPKAPGSQIMGRVRTIA